MWKILVGNCLQKLQELDEQSIHCCITSPPYWGLRDYKNDEQLGQEETPEKFVDNLVEVFEGVKRVLRDDGTVWLNIGDTNKNKSLVGVPWMVAFAMKNAGWYLRSEIIWHKPNPMPESVKDRPTRAHEHIFLLSKNKKYYYDADAIKTKSISPSTKKRTHRRTTAEWADGTGQSAHSGFDKEYTTANKRDVWTVPVKPYPEAHFATYPTDLIEPCVLAGCPIGGTVLDVFSGSGTTGIVACQKNRNYIGIELNPDYAKLSEERFSKEAALDNFFV